MANSLKIGSIPGEMDFIEIGGVRVSGSSAEDYWSIHALKIWCQFY